MTTHTDLIARLRGYATRDGIEAADALEPLEQQVAALTKEHEFACEIGADYRDKWMAAQAREAKLRGAIADDSFAITFQSIGQYRSALLKLALPADDTALQARLKEERERCKKECEGFTHRDDKEVAEAIAVAIGSMT